MPISLRSRKFCPSFWSSVISAGTPRASVGCAAFRGHSRDGPAFEPSRRPWPEAYGRPRGDRTCREIPARLAKLDVATARQDSPQVQPDPVTAGCDLIQTCICAGCQRGTDGRCRKHFAVDRNAWLEAGAVDIRLARAGQQPRKHQAFPKRAARHNPVAIRGDWSAAVPAARIVPPGSKRGFCVVRNPSRTPRGATSHYHQPAWKADAQGGFRSTTRSALIPPKSSGMPEGKFPLSRAGLA